SDCASSGPVAIGPNAWVAIATVNASRAMNRFMRYSVVDLTPASSRASLAKLSRRCGLRYPFLRIVIITSNSNAIPRWSVGRDKHSVVLVRSGRQIPQMRRMAGVVAIDRSVRQLPHGGYRAQALALACVSDARSAVLISLLAHAAGLLAL